MRIVGPNASARTAAPAAPRRTAAGGFSVAETDSGRAAEPVATLRTIGGIDALMALQGQDERTERRRRAVTRGRTALDALDQLKAELLSGAPAPTTIMRLKSASAELTAASGDNGLDTVLAEIDLRLAVEIAKMTPR
jgi:Class II flagellar assembly regulator